MNIKGTVINLATLRDLIVMVAFIEREKITVDIFSYGDIYFYIKVLMDDVLILISKDCEMESNTILLNFYEREKVLSGKKLKVFDPLTTKFFNIIKLASPINFITTNFEKTVIPIKTQNSREIFTTAIFLNDIILINQESNELLTGLLRLIRNLRLKGLVMKSESTSKFNSKTDKYVLLSNEKIIFSEGIDKIKPFAPIVYII